MGGIKINRLHSCLPGFIATAVLVFFLATPLHAAILWRDPAVRLAHNTGAGVDILHGAVKPQGKNSSGTLYFKFTVDPISDFITEEKLHGYYLAGLVLYEKNTEHLGVGNALIAWGYSAFNVSGKGPSNQTPGEWNLSSLNYNIESIISYEAPRHGAPSTIVFKVQYVPGSDANITVWLNPDLRPGQTEIGQNAELVTQFKANACFDEIHLVHRGGGDGWKFGDIAVATSFEDFVPRHLWERWWFVGSAALALFSSVALTVHLLERRRARWRIQRLEHERALEQERNRIARDIHDDLGASLSQLALLGEMVGNEVQTPANVVAQARIISDSARTMMESLESIVWAVRPENDSLRSLVEYMARRTDELFENSRVQYALAVPPEIPDFNLHAETRHNIYLAYKESLANALKHAKATSITIDLAWVGEEFQVEIRDNGTGFDPENRREGGHGLNNIQRRMDEIGGRFELQTTPGSGTTIRLAIPLRERKLT